MNKWYRINSAVVLLLAALFFELFMFLKHDAALSKIIPFGDDPFDAVGSFAMIVGIMVALLAFGRAFWPYRLNSASIENQVHLARAQTCVVLAVLITLVSDGVALARHPETWMTSPDRNELLGLLGGMAFFTTGVALSIRRCTKTLTSTEVRPGWTRAAVVGLVGILILAVYPENMIQRTVTHLFTIVVGALILFATIRSMLTALVPYETDSVQRAATDEKPSVGRMRRWGIVLMVGLFLGVFLFGSEMREGAERMSLGQIVFVGAVFVGVSTIGLAIAYAFLGTPLGLERQM